MPDQLVLPLRAQALIKVHSLSKGNWTLVVEAVRPECRGKWMDKAHTALEVGLNDAAINYFWSAVEGDLRTKIMAYGVEYFAPAINKPDLRTLDDLKTEVQAHELIDGCYALGIIGQEAHFFLHHARELRNFFSTAHEPIGELDRLETLNFIKNSVKYVLCFEPPPPGFSIKDLISHLASEPLRDPEELIAMVRAQSSRIHGPMLHNLFSQWIHPTANSTLKQNVGLIAPEVWKLCNEQSRTEVAQRYASLRELPTPSSADEALNFLKLVGGVGYVPSDIRYAIFRRFAQNLLDAYSGYENFHNEPPHARSLAELGSKMPPQAAGIYVKAVLLSFVGNFYGHSFAAEPYTKAMICAFEAPCLQALEYLLEHDAFVAAVLTEARPSRRLKVLADLVVQKTMSSALAKKVQMIQKQSEEKIRTYFTGVHARCEAQSQPK